MIKEVVAERAPNIPVCISFEVLPEIKEYERFDNRNKCVSLPIVADYLASLADQFMAASSRRHFFLCNQMVA